MDIFLILRLHFSSNLPLKKQIEKNLFLYLLPSPVYVGHKCIRFFDHVINATCISTSVFRIFKIFYTLCVQQLQIVP